MLPIRTRCAGGLIEYDAAGLSEPAKQTFTMVVERDPESGWLVGEIVELPGCYSQAPDLQQLEANVREAVEAYLKSSEESLRHVDEPRPDFIGTRRIEVAA